MGNNKNISEKIFNGSTTIIAFDDVQHIEKHWFAGDKRTEDNYRGIIIITKHTKWDMDADTWSNSAYLERKEADLFIDAWTKYKLELITNSKLIAAAPKLLKALKSCVLSMQAHPDCVENSEFEGFVENGWNAITKAIE